MNLRDEHFQSAPIPGTPQPRTFEQANGERTAGHREIETLGADLGGDRLQVVSVPEIGTARDYYVICGSGHASLPGIAMPTLPYCEVCDAIREGQRRFTEFAIRAARVGYRRED